MRSHDRGIEPDRGKRREKASKFGLWRVLGAPFGLAMVVGGSIGSGILRAPGAVAAAMPNGPLIVLAWAFGGLLASIEALPLIELATALPRAGGAVVYVERAFGHLAGTMIGWCSMLQCVVSLAFMAVVFGEYANRLKAGIPTGLWAIALIALCTALNLTDTRTTGWSQTIGVLVKLVGLLALIGFLFAAPPLAPTTHQSVLPLSLGGVAIGLMLVNNAYQGWSAIVPFAEEIRDPARTMARAMFGGIAIICTIYVAMNVALLHALPIDMLMRSTLPAGEAMARVAGSIADRLITLLSLISVVAIVNLTTMLPARILLAMGRNGSAPALLARVARNGSPYVSTLIVGIVAAIFASSGAYVSLNAMYAPLALLTTIAVVLAAWRLRHSEPALVRPFRMPGHPVPVLLALTINIALFVSFVVAAPGEAFGSLALVALALPLSLLHWRREEFVG